MKKLGEKSGAAKSFTHTLIGIAMAAAVYGVMKILMLDSVNIINPFYLMIVQKICIDVILALGLNLITGITGQFSLGHAGFMAIGAYTAALAIIKLPINIGTVILVCIMASITAGIAGFLIGVPTLRLKGDYLAIATLGFAEIIRIFILNYDQSVLGGAAGLSSLPRYTSFEFAFLGFCITFFIIRNFIKSSFGRACISVREDDVAAESMGINLTKTKMLAFVIGTAIAGFAGALYAGNIGYISPKDFGFMKSIEILMIVVIGGLGNIWGTIGAAIFMNVISTALQDFSEIRMVLYALALVIVMLVKSGESPLLIKIRLLTNKIFSFQFLKGKKTDEVRKLK